MDASANVENGPSNYTRSVNGKVAVEPFPIVGIRKTATGTGAVKVGGVENTSTLTKLKVVFLGAIKEGADRMTYVVEGNYVYVKTEIGSQPYAKDVYEIDGKKFVLIPADRIELVTNG